jgi:formylglycine-generating enzyme required for sulfatase activity
MEKTLFSRRMVWGCLLLLAFAFCGCTGEKQSFVETVNGVSFEMIHVDGSTLRKEQPKGFFIGQTEVTQELWEAVMGSNPSCFKGKGNPVEYVNWNECQDFIAKLNKLTGKAYRLPTEEEWEFAAQGGNKSQAYEYSGSNNIDEVAWNWNNSDKKTHPVKQKAANELGLYDMSGNVYEWCEDLTTLDDTIQVRAIRGGSWWADDIDACRISCKRNLWPDNNDNNVGLRLAL